MKITLEGSPKELKEFLSKYKYTTFYSNDKPNRTVGEPIG